MDLKVSYIQYVYIDGVGYFPIDLRKNHSFNIVFKDTHSFSVEVQRDLENLLSGFFHKPLVDATRLEVQESVRAFFKRVDAEGKLHKGVIPGMTTIQGDPLYEAY